jgi:predicted NACHT family NTPase
LDLFSLLAMNVGVAAWKLLLKRWLGDDGGAVAGGVVEALKSKFDDAYEQKEAERQFERIGDKIAKRMVPLFQEASRRGELNLESISYQIGLTLEGNISAEFFVARDLDPAKLTAALRQTRPLPEATFSEAETSFYERALDEAVRYVVGLASRLPKFDEEVAAQTLQRLSRLEDDLEEVLDTVQRVERTVGSTQDRSIHISGSSTDSINVSGNNNIIIQQDAISQHQAERYEADYRHRLQQNLDKVELFGADIPEEAQRNLLSDAFVSLNVTAEGKDGGGLLSCEAVFDSLNPLNGRLIIRGAAGSGKTTLMRWAAIMSATQRKEICKVVEFVPETNAERDEFMSEWLDAANRQSKSNRILRDKTGRNWTWEEMRWSLRIPFLILLRHCQDGQLPEPDEFPKMVAKELGDPPVNWVRSVLDNGRALVLIDGVDEVPGDKRKGIYDELKRIVETYKDSYFVVTTRPTAVKKDWLKPLGFREAEVTPMSADHIHRFVDKWHDAVARELGRQGKPAGELGRMAEQLNEKIDDDPPLFRLATNPLLCAMICALHRKTRQKLPQGQRAIVESLCQMLLHERERQGGLDWTKFPEEYRDLSYPQKRAIVQKLAEHMMLEGESAVDTGRSQKQVELALESVPGRSPADAPVVLESLVERSGMLREPSPGKIDFLHNTFKEMLAGDYLAQDDKVKMLAERALADVSWRRAALFAVAGDKPERQPFNDLLVRTGLDMDNLPGKLTKQRKQERRDRHLFLVQCKSVVQFLDTALEKTFAFGTGNPLARA